MAHYVMKWGSAQIVLLQVDFFKAVPLWWAEETNTSAGAATLHHFSLECEVKKTGDQSVALFRCVEMQSHTGERVKPQI